MRKFMTKQNISVWIDGRNRFLEQGTGVTSYTCALEECLQAMGITPHYIVDAPATQAGRKLDIASRLRRAAAMSATVAPTPQEHSSPPRHLAPDIFRIARLHHALYRRVMPLETERPPRIMHWTYPLPLFMRHSLNVLTLHDLIPITHPLLTGISPLRHQRMLAQLVRKMHAVVTVSETIRHEVINLLKLDPDKVTTLYQKVSIDEALIQRARAAPPLVPPGGFVFVGRVERRKNIHRLVQAYRLSGVTTPLYFIGPDGDGDLSAFNRTLPPNVYRLPWQERHLLIKTIMEARALLFPTLAEGFGLPVAEAMTLGTPVLTSQHGATQELAQGAALLVDAYNVGEIALAIRVLDQSEELRRSLVAAGLERARLFTAENHTRRLENFYACLLDSPHRQDNKKKPQPLD